MTTFSMGSDQTLRDELATALSRFLNGVCTLDSFQEYLLSHLQAILDSKDALAIEVANELDADLIQLSERLIDDTAFLNRVQSWEARLRTVLVELFDQQEKEFAVAATSFVSKTIERKLEHPLTLRPSLGFGEERWSGVCTQLS